MTSHAIKNSLSTANYDFIANPVVFTSNSNANLNLVATSYGAALKPSGFRLWDQSSLPLDSTTTLTSNQSLLVPFIATDLPAQYFDAIILLTVDGITRIPYAFSNSPDNTEPTTPAANKNLYWADLYCFGLQNQRGNNYTTNNYMFGGIEEFNEAATNYKINFSEPLAAPLTYSWQVKYISYTLGLNSYTLSGTVTAPVNALSSTYFSGNIVQPFYNNNGSTPHFSAGYYEVTFVVADTNFRSMLKKYHFGVAGS
jgi:hypothetical protein